MWLPNKVCIVWTRDGQVCWCVCVFGNSRTPRHPAQSFRLQGRTVGIISRRVSQDRGLGPLTLSSALWRVAGWEELQRARSCLWPVRGCFRLRAARASTSRDKTTTLTIPNPAHHTTPSIFVRSRRAATARLAHPIAHLPHTSDQCSGCSLAIGPSLYKYLPDAVPRLRTLVSRIPRAFTADSNDHDDNNDHNTQSEKRITVCGFDAPIESA